MTEKVPGIIPTGEKIHPQLFCPICEKVFDCPVVISCGHSFCNICIALWMRRQSDCPVCKRQFETFKTWVNRPIAKIIAYLQTKCCHPSCQWIGSYKQLKRHQRRCQFGSKKQISQIPSDRYIDLVDDQPKWGSPQKKSIANEFLNFKKQIFNFNFPRLPNTPFPMIENQYTFLMASKQMIQTEEDNFQYFHQDQYESDSDESRGVIFNEEEYQKAHSRPSNSISLQRRTTWTGSNSESERKHQNEVTVNKGAQKKQERIIIKSLIRELENYNQGTQSKYITKNVIQSKQNSQYSRNNQARINTRQRSRNKEKTYHQAHSKPQCPNTTTRPIKILKKKHSKNSEEWKP